MGGGGVGLAPQPITYLRPWAKVKLACLGLHTLINQANLSSTIHTWPNNIGLV